MPRSVVCDLAQTERAPHRRWQDADLLARKSTYGRNDVVRAAALDLLWATVGPARATAAWHQIESSLGVPSVSLDVVLDPSTREAVLARDPAELSRMLPRDRQVFVIDVGARVQRAMTRLDAYVAVAMSTPSGRSGRTVQPLSNRVTDAARSH
jgi:hypothetical protein